ncbi:MAG: FumA C-terminus/TtdB family hydratase beta subunit [bacterium]|nr:FumA C-terminus/TtdB family hydratase beta subunit [bacterium]MBU1918611.1 FumA C-terminus/TtdB family hydratase beta subunit [bacterium]
MITLQLPITEEKIRELKIGDEVLISGIMVTARDAAHKFLIDEEPEEYKEILGNTFIYHCGPVVKKDDAGNWEFVAAGPTTSIREEPYEATVIKNFNVKGVIGKGGMGDKTLAALKEHGAVYLHAIGGLATVLAESVTKVTNVYMLDELGVPEAFWEIDVKDFPAVVTMDSHGNSLHKIIKAKSDMKMKEILTK